MNENNCRPLLRAASFEFGATVSSYYDDVVLIFVNNSFFSTAWKRTVSSFSRASRRKRSTFGRSRRKLRTDGPQSPRILIFPSQSVQYIQGANRRCRWLNGRFHLKSRSLAGQRDHYRGQRKVPWRNGHLNTRNSRPDHVNTEMRQTKRRRFGMRVRFYLQLR